MKSETKAILKKSVCCLALFAACGAGIRLGQFTSAPQKVEYEDVNGDNVADIVITSDQGRKYFFLGQKNGYIHAEELDKYYLSLTNFQRPHFLSVGIKDYLSKVEGEKL